MRCALVLLAMTACHEQADQSDTPLLTQTDARTLVDVTTQVTKLIALQQPHGENSAAMDITVSQDILCTGGGTGHVGGEAHYVPAPGTSFGQTTFDVKVSLADCAFFSGAISSMMLSVRGTVQTGASVSNLTYRGEVSWSTTPDPCQVTLKIWGKDYDDFEGFACAVSITPDSIPRLPL